MTRRRRHKRQSLGNRVANFIIGWVALTLLLWIFTSLSWATLVGFSIAAVLAVMSPLIEAKAREDCIKRREYRRMIIENNESWIRDNRNFIEKENRREFAKLTKGPSADDSSTVGHYGSDVGDGDGFGF